MRTRTLFLLGLLIAAVSPAEIVRQWDVHEIVLHGPAEGNPFLDVEISATFTRGSRSFEAGGFYDGGGTYRVRFMPGEQGRWTWRTRSNRPELDGKTGEFTVGPAAPGNHGPVRVRGRFHFAYADGTPYFPFGTTCYAWAHQGNGLEERTLATLRTAGFNKIRMTVFPKDYKFSKNEPVYHPYARGGQGKPDFTRFDPEFFRHFEKRVGQLAELGIEADIILFHPYDRWGYSRMDEQSDFRYLGYVMARLSAYRNVWWSAANEYDIMSKPPALWDRYFQFIEQHDPYGHLRSIHNGRILYDHSKPWITHVSIQYPDTGKASEWREKWGKPVIDDECEYEGNVPDGWGNLTAQELTNRVWNGVIDGVYVGHGETYLDPGDVLWWSKGGVLHGESYKRMAFLRKLVEERSEGIDSTPNAWSWRSQASGAQGPVRWAYLANRQPAEFETGGLPEGQPYRVDIIDAWNMTVRTLPETFRGKAVIPLPGKPYIAVRIKPVP